MRSDDPAPNRGRLAVRLAASALAAAATLVAAAAAAAPEAPAPRAAGQNLSAPAPHVRLATGAEQVGSYNWAGWAQNGPAGMFHAVIDTWTVPVVDTSTPGDQYSADWVGIGGYSDETLVQAGTEADNIGGTTRYRAWTEILPEAENPLPMAIHPGDRITVTVREIAAGVWKMTVTDRTTNKTESRRQPYAGSTHASVEAIHERPCLIAPCSTAADFAELAQTTKATFDPGRYALVLGAPPATALLKPAAGDTLYQVSMLGNSGTAPIASPSLADRDSDGFAVADGSTAPPPPKS
jgi:Peptidase A4 family